MEPISRTFTDNSWVFILLLSIIVVLGVSRIIFQRNFGALDRLSLFQENQENFFPFALMTNVLLVTLIGLVLYPFVEVNWNPISSSRALNLFVIIFLWLILRFLINTLLIFLLGLSDYYRDIFKAKGYFRIFAVFLLFIAVLFLYFSDLNQNWVFYTSLGIIGALVLLEYIFQLRRNGLSWLYGSYYFILYLCMLEILPILYVIHHWNR